MENQFKLKKKAKEFFDKKFHTKLMSLGSWEENGVSMLALEEVRKIYTTHGHKTSSCSTLLCSHDFDRTAMLYLTVNVACASEEEYEILKDENNVSELMEKLDSFISDFVAERLIF